jgi:hypothetical protein
MHDIPTWGPVGAGSIFSRLEIPPLALKQKPDKRTSSKNSKGTPKRLECHSHSASISQQKVEPGELRNGGRDFIKAET